MAKFTVISTFVLNYRVTPFRHPIPFLDAQRAIRQYTFQCGKIQY